MNQPHRMRLLILLEYCSFPRDYRVRREAMSFTMLAAAYRPFILRHVAVMDETLIVVNVVNATITRLS